MQVNHKTAVRVYEIISYLLILGATAIFFLLKEHPMRMSLVMLVIALAMVARWMIERHRFRACEEELDMAQQDLRRLTQLLAEEKKKNANNSIKQ